VFTCPCKGFYQFDPEAYATFVSDELGVPKESVTITVVEAPDLVKADVAVSVGEEASVREGAELSVCVDLNATLGGVCTTTPRIVVVINPAPLPPPLPPSLPPSSPPPASPPPPPPPSMPPLKVITCGGPNQKCNSKRFAFDAADGHVRLDCIGKDGCNSVKFECKEGPSQCSVTCKDGKPACNSLTVTRGITVSCSPGACNSVEPRVSVVPTYPDKDLDASHWDANPKTHMGEKAVEYLHRHSEGR